MITGGLTTQRRVRVGAAVVVLTLGLLAGCSSGGSSGTGTTDRGGGGTTTTVVAAPTRSFAVGVRTTQFVDESRPTVGNPARKIPAATSRTLPVTILYPTAGDASPEGAAVDTQKDAAPADGKFPLVVFSHGVTANGSAYVPVLATWARAGFVVVAPTFPMTSGSGAWDDLKDYMNQPGDVSFLIDKMTADDAENPLAGHVDGAEVGAAGHSLGAVTTLGFYNSCCRDPRVKAAIALSGILVPFNGGDWNDPPQIPLLMVHGGDDKTVPYAGGSANTFANLDVPRALVSIPAAGHTDIFGGEGEEANGTSTTAAAIAFLQLELRHDDSAWKKLGATLDTLGVAWVEVDGLPSTGPGGDKAKPAS